MGSLCLPGIVAGECGLTGYQMADQVCELNSFQNNSVTAGSTIFPSGSVDMVVNTLNGYKIEEKVPTGIQFDS